MSEFIENLKRAKAGDKDAIGKIVDRYMPLIISNSMNDDLQINEDCRQYIMLNVIIAIKRFEPLICHCCHKGQANMQHNAKSKI